MRGINAPFGFKPVRTMTGTSWSGQLEEFEIDPNYIVPRNGTLNDIYTNDPVSTLSVYSSGDPSSYGYLAAAYAFKPESGDTNAGLPLPIIGVFQGCRYTDLKGDTVFSPYWKSGTPIKPNTKVLGLVATDPNLVYQVQCSNFEAVGQGQFFGALSEMRGNTNYTLRPAYGGFAGNASIPGNPEDQGNDVSGISNGYLDLRNPNSANFYNMIGPRFLILGLAKIEGNDWCLKQDPALDKNIFNIVEVVCLDHIAKVAPPYRVVPAPAPNQKPTPKS